MSEFKWIQTCVFLMALLQFAETTETKTVRVGGEVTLSCENVIKDQENCRRTTWIFSYLKQKTSQTLFEEGKIHEDVGAKSDRLSVTENCSLVIQKVTEEDDGLYLCQQKKPGVQDVKVSRVSLSVRKSAQQFVEVCSSVLGEETRPPPPPPTTTVSAVSVTSAGRPGVRRDRCGLDIIMLVLRVAELVLMTMITVLLFRARGRQRPRDDYTVHHDGDDGTVNYENVGEASASVRLH